MSNTDTPVKSSGGRSPRSIAHVRETARIDEVRVALMYQVALADKNLYDSPRP